MFEIVARAGVRRVLLLAGLVFAALAAGSALAHTARGQTGTPVRGPQDGVKYATSSAMPAAGALPAGSAAGGPRPDRTFGGGKGFVATRIMGASSVAYSSVVLSGGGIVAAGRTSTPSGKGQIIVVRYRKDGRLDRAFGRDGVFESRFPASQGPFRASAIAKAGRTGKLLIAGGYGEGSMLVMRLTARGRLDRTFGPRHRGFVRLSVGGIANSLAIASDGDIFVGGSDANLNGRPFVVAKLTRGGALDRTFGRGGVARIIFWKPKPASSAGVTGLAATRGGGVIASGHIDYIGGNHGSTPGHGSAGVFRLDPRGVPVASFGVRGHVQVTFFNRRHVALFWFPNAMGVDARGRITVTGGGGSDALLTARFTGSGSLDRSYGPGHNGHVVIRGIGGSNLPNCGAVVRRSGRLTAGVGRKLAQLEPDGRLDRSFGRDGVFTVTRPAKVEIDSVSGAGAGRVILAGSTRNDVYVARYLLPR
ncbi:MAG: hypothetical protein ACTHQQ_01085 [Solirubrobacteraceae bacterium]